MNTCEHKNYIGNVLYGHTVTQCSKSATHRLPNTRVNNTMIVCEHHYNKWIKKVGQTKWFQKKYSNSNFKINTQNT